MLPMTTDKITKEHRDKHAYIYVRQSSPKQVLHNRESQQNQYALVERAITLGWIGERVRVIVADLCERYSKVGHLMLEKQATP